MTIKQAAWQKNYGAESAQFEDAHPYPHENALGCLKNKSIKASRFPGWQLLVIGVIATLLILL